MTFDFTQGFYEDKILNSNMKNNEILFDQRKSLQFLE